MAALSSCRRCMGERSSGSSPRTRDATFMNLPFVGDTSSSSMRCPCRSTSEAWSGGPSRRRSSSTRAWTPGSDRSSSPGSASSPRRWRACGRLFRHDGTVVVCDAGPATLLHDTPGLRRGPARRTGAFPDRACRRAGCRPRHRAVARARGSRSQPGTLYHHFPSKQELLIAVHDRCIEGLCPSSAR